MYGGVDSIRIESSYLLREADRARTKVRVWSRSLDPIDSIGQLLSITVGRNTPAEEILARLSRDRKKLLWSAYWCRL